MEPEHEEPKTESESSSAPPNDLGKEEQEEQTQTEEEKVEEKEESTSDAPAVDEEGLRKDGYDVILCGTGLIQSILASSLARVGQSVLHCDGNEFYGELDAVLTLGGLVDFVNKDHTSTTPRASTVKKEEERGSDSKADDNDDTINTPSNKKSIAIHPSGSYSSLVVHSSTGTSKDATCLEVGMKIMTPYGEGIIESLPTSKENTGNLIVSLYHWIMADGQSPKAYFGFHHSTSPDNDESHDDDIQSISTYYAQNHDIIPISQYQYQKYVLSKQRNYALDLTPNLLYANGDAVTGMVDSGVSDYCEFKNLIGLYLFMEEKKGGGAGGGGLLLGQKMKMKGTTATQNKNSDNASKSESRTTTCNLSEVPCSKGDVFQTKLLSPVDKRRLMKFLQLAFDYATVITTAPPAPKKSSTDIANTNTKNDNDKAETEKNNEDGSEEATVVQKSDTQETNTPIEEEVVTSLNERQLKHGRSLYRPQNKSVSTSDLEVLQQCIIENMDFDTYLKTKMKLTDRLRRIVIYAMAMGSYNDNDHASYSTKEGMNDLCRHLQSLGRYGKTAFLVPLYGAGELSQAFCRSAAVHGGTYLLRRGATEVLLSDDTSDDGSSSGSTCGIMLNGDEFDGRKVESKKIIAKNVVLPADSIVTPPPATTTTATQKKRRILRRISILNGKLMTDDENNEQRHAIIIPPDSIGNANVIHCIALDESANVAPWNCGDGFTTTVLHLTTTIDSLDGEENMEDDDILEKAVQALLQNRRRGSAEKGGDDIEEVHHTCFSYDDESSDSSNTPTTAPPSASGLYVCSQQGQSLAVDTAFREAKIIFDKICPGYDFLKLSEGMIELVKDRQHKKDDDDVDGAVLNSAMGMIGTTPTD